MFTACGIMHRGCCLLAVDVLATSESGVRIALVESAGVDVLAASESGVRIALVESAGVDVLATSLSAVQGRTLAECTRILLHSTVRSADCHRKCTDITVV